MSFLNSVINQVGREVGRDIYNGAKYSLKSNKSIVSNSSILNSIRRFQVSPYDKVTFRNIGILYNSIEQINPRSFDWMECHVEFDELLDSLKIDKQYQEGLDLLDKQNSVAYSVNKEHHKTFVNSLIEDYEGKVNFYNRRNGFLTFFLTLVGLNSLYTCKENKALSILGVIWMFLAYFTFFINSEPSLGLKIYSFLFIASPTLICSIYRAFDHRSTNRKNTDSLISLKEYKEKL